MKIFISHSRDEEWLAEMIAAELRDIGADPRYYESNETGAPIDERVRAEIEACDEFLILLTPTSIWSHWVLYELAIAHYLRKRIRPFSMYVGDDQIPPAARNYLRRPIGEIPRYFDEIRLQLVNPFTAGAISDLPPQGAPPSLPAAVLPVVNQQQLVGRLRRIVRTAPAVPPGSDPPAAPTTAQTEKPDGPED
jgi:hypothetical protein